MARRTGERAVKIDDMQFLSALFAPIPRLKRGIVAIDGHIIGFALTKPNTFAVLEVDSGKNYHENKPPKKPSLMLL